MEEQNDEIVKLFVRSQIFHTYRSTLNRASPEFLQIINEALDKTDCVDEDGEIYIDQDPRIFRIVLNFLRNGKTTEHIDVFDTIAVKKLREWGMSCVFDNVTMVDKFVDNVAMINNFAGGSSQHETRAKIIHVSLKDLFLFELEKQLADVTLGIPVLLESPDENNTNLINPWDCKENPEEKVLHRPCTRDFDRPFAKLNVGGTMFIVKKSFVSSWSKYFESLFSESFGDVNGQVMFIDRDPILFSAMLGGAERWTGDYSSLLLKPDPIQHDPIKYAVPLERMICDNGTLHP